jgi:hypothetical protein|tara:strand:- start:4114 stop:5052 length:939 start_codon:yes stop_codon:yes gene_type:complete
MDPLTIAVATFGIQKLRGKSTKRAFRDAALLAGGTQLLGSTGFGQNLGVRAFGGSGGIGSFGETTLGKLMGVTPKGYKIGATTPEGLPQLDSAGNIVGTKQQIANLTGANEGVSGALKGIGSYIKDNPGTALIAASAAAPLLMSGGDEELEMPPGTRPEDYEKALAESRKGVEGIGSRATYGSQPLYSAQNIYQYNTGGIVNALPKFAVGGINYLPSKIDHDENDRNNYVRAEGYVEDGSGNGDKDEDTMLAQLADGEFVSRADAILGAGIMEGANPKNYKDMRKKGAAFFYDQQAKFKRVFDLLDASRKLN